MFHEGIVELLGSEGGKVLVHDPLEPHGEKGLSSKVAREQEPHHQAIIVEC